nr:matrix metalloproteinase-18-like isoform X1 [Danio rerio]|eukprot:XP_021335120.1 matrix metalloproteinase-18-like isoform X1 [Danio rerio]
MWSLWFGLFTLLQPALVFTAPLRPAGLSRDGHLELAEVYLVKFYNHKPENGRRRRTAGLDPFQAKLREMQHFFGLEESGEVDPQTIRAMRRARCGLSDVERFGKTMRWTNKTLTYKISKFSSKMSSARVKTAFRQAWQLWAQAAPLKFRRKRRSDADIVISFNNKDHNDGSPFDGEGGILAHAFSPGPGIGGDVHFDDEETWTTNGSGYNLLPVAVHEFGHALGLSHSSDPGAIMFPAYNFGLHSVLQLSYQDVKDIKEMYGERSTSPDLLPPKTPDRCDPDLSFDAVTGMQQELVFFKDRFIWRVHPSFDEIRITLITSLWTEIPADIDAAYENTNKNSILVFKGSQYWEMLSSLKVKEGFPRNISDFGFPSSVKSIDAVLSFRETHLTDFFIGGECWRFNEDAGQMMEGFPKPIALEWPGIKSPVDAVVAHDGRVYFFIGPQQLEFTPPIRRVTQRLPANTWLRC